MNHFLKWRCPKKGEFTAQNCNSHKNMMIKPSVAIVVNDKKYGEGYSI